MHAGHLTVLLSHLNISETHSFQSSSFFFFVLSFLLPKCHSCYSSFSNRNDSNRYDRSVTKIIATPYQWQNSSFWCQITSVTLTLLHKRQQNSCTHFSDFTCGTRNDSGSIKFLGQFLCCGNRNGIRSKS